MKSIGNKYDLSAHTFIVLSLAMIFPATYVYITIIYYKSSSISNH